MHPLAERVSELARMQNLFPGYGKIVVAVSGGLDSMVLLDLLVASELNIRGRLVVAHFNHQLRGAESDADAVFVEESARSYDLPFELGCADVSLKAKELSGGLEAVAREVRHSFFASLSNRLGCSTVALAHHLDDQVETFFIRLFRGAGGRGLAGMSVLSSSHLDPEVKLVRPLLELRRIEIEAYAQELGINHREDESNNDTRFLRNKIRHDLLPYMFELFNPSIHRQIIKTMGLVGDDSDCIDAIAMKWLSKENTAFEKLPVAVQRKVLQRQLFSKSVESSFDLVESLRTKLNQAIEVSPGKRLIRKETGMIEWLPFMNKRVFSIDRCEIDLFGKKDEIEFDGLKFWFERVSGGLDKFAELGQKSNREVFDARSLGSHITLRHWSPGDRFQPIGQTGEKKLQDLFVNKKIPLSERHRRAIGESDDGRLFWVNGLRIADPFKVTVSTTELLLFHWEE
jgi:tRNA(Ile)-lysidine synthase